MGLFRKDKSANITRTAEEYRKAAELHREAARNMRNTFLKTGIFTVATVIVLVFSGVAWFAANNRVQAGTTAIAAADDTIFSLATRQEDKQGVYDQNESKEQIGAEEQPSALARALNRFYRADRNGRDDDEGNYYTSFLNLPDLKEGDSTFTDINGNTYILGDSDGISLMVSAQSNVNNTEEFEYLEPGSCGQLTFYIIPHIENFHQVTLSVSLQAFTLVRDTESSNSEEISGKAIPVTNDGNEVLLNMLQGHMMLFEEKDNDGNYKNRILPVLKDDGKIGFEFKKDDIQWVKDQAAPITVYWIWPRRFENIKYCGQEDSVFVSECEEHTALLKWINKNKKLMVNTNVIDPNGLSDLNSSMTNQQFSQWNTGYNKGDQLIGDNIAFIQWIIKAE